MKIFSPDGFLYRTTELIGNLIILNLLCILCCIPIVTIGPSLTAMYSVAMKLAQNEEEGIVKPFFHSFRINLKQGIVVGLLMTAVGIFLAFDLYYIYQLMMNGGFLDKVIFVVVLLACVVYLMGSVYIYPLLAKFENTTKQMIKTAGVLAIRHLPATICMLVMTAAPVLMFLYTPTAAALAYGFCMTLGVATIGFLQSKFLVRIFWQYIPREETETEEEG